MTAAGYAPIFIPTGPGTFDLADEAAGHVAVSVASSPGGEGLTDVDFAGIGWFTPAPSWLRVGTPSTGLEAEPGSLIAVLATIEFSNAIPVGTRIWARMDCSVLAALSPARQVLNNAVDRQATPMGDLWPGSRTNLRAYAGQNSPAAVNATAYFHFVRLIPGEAFS